ncbi:DUF6292 family protein [Actinosynnema sp. NPDC047251]|uniref:DUF6292 domain-containing protein n=1 Tax=Saccharothrix espanaensis (strain ATCC 51144 / DSM 44229 / JCM 9112 / NBRC 15066 / NRRL 15764) TaxID=1179773 RepID=K0K6Y8_SACES|nr:DUF6292 family protein [Saccharothrix espanaensis]CCH32363.1 hypothetical protein BN6_50970 [Saccharothrix espanaensis DSM 44229]
MRVEWDFDDSVVRALQSYVRLVADELRLSGESSYVQVEPPRSVYVALDGRLPGYPDRDVALVWDETAGWAVALETHSGEDLIVQARFGADRVPPPAAVARWVRQVFDGQPTTGTRTAADGWSKGDLAVRLAPYAGSGRGTRPWRDVHLLDVAEHSVQ